MIIRDNYLDPIATGAQFLAHHMESYQLPGFEGFFRYMYERQRIWHRRMVLRLSREAWTTDPTLRKYNFTNAYRELDRGTQHYIYKILNADILNFPAQLLMLTVAYRFFNRIETWDECFAPVCNPETFELDLEKAHDLVRRRAARGDAPFTSAFIVCGYTTYPGATKVDKVFNFLTWLNERKESMTETLLTHAEERGPAWVHSYLQSIPGVGAFLAYEIYSDLIYTGGCLLPDFWNENTWVNPGPGAKRGLREIYPGTTLYTDGICGLWDIAAEAFAHFDLAFDDVAIKELNGLPRPLSLRSIEHNLCEYSKYVRGRGRVKFKQVTMPEASELGIQISRDR